MNPARVIFAGSPDFAAESLRGLLDSLQTKATPAFEIVACYTQPDRPSGRGKKLTMTPVKQLALDHDIPVEQPLNFKDPEAREKLASYQADLMIVVAYGLILPQSVLDTPRLGCINVHASLLPRWRGAAPIQRAIAAGDRVTGITIMQMERGLDTGPMLAKCEIAIDDKDTGASLHDKLAAAGSSLLVATLPSVLDQSVVGEVQTDYLTTYAAKLEKSEAIIDWNLSAANIERKVRAYNSWPVAFTHLDGQKLRIWQARPEIPDNAADSTAPGSETLGDRDLSGNNPCGEILAVESSGIAIATGVGKLWIETLQLSGSKAMSVSALINGRPDLFRVGGLLG